MIPQSVHPLLLEIQRSIAAAARSLNDQDFPLEFWQIHAADLREEGFYELAELLDENFSRDELMALPQGYRVVRDLFTWESACANEGWVAFDNTPEGDMEPIFMAYRTVGLDGEADALHLAYEVWKTDPENYDAMGQAYGSIPHDYSDDMDRIPYLIQFLTRHADALFHQYV